MNVVAMDNLPNDVLYKIFGYLGGKQIGRMRMVNTQFDVIGKHVHPWLQKALSCKRLLSSNRNTVDMDVPIFNYRNSLNTYEEIEYWSKICVIYKSQLSGNGLHDAIFNALSKREYELMANHFVNDVTTEQRAIIETPPQAQIIVVQAFAGTGKTTTLFNYAKRWRQHRILYLAYNNALAKESKIRFQELTNVHVMTIHSLALNKLDPTMNIGKLKISDVQELFSIDLIHSKEILDVLNQYCSTDETTDSTNEYVRQLWDKMFVEKSIKVLHDAYVKQFQKSQPVLDKYDIIMLDEVQDCTDCILNLIATQTHATRIFVGDVYQKIYGFRHVGDPFEYLSNVPCHQTQFFKLSVSFRMGFDLMHYSNMYLQRMFNVNKGFSCSRRTNNTRIKTIDFNDDSIRSFPKGTVIICRYNANVYKTLFKLCELQIPYDVYGKCINFDKEIKIVRDLLCIQEGDFDNIQHRKLKQFESIQQVYDHFTSVQSHTWKDRVRLFNLYGEEQLLRNWTAAKVGFDKSCPSIVITTAHQSKGCEFNHVCLYDDFSLHNEDTFHTLYVAMTRAKDILYTNETLLKIFKKSIKCVAYYSHKIKTSKSRLCSCCHRINTNQQVCVENDPISIIEGNSCQIYEYLPMCNMCIHKKNTINNHQG